MTAGGHVDVHGDVVGRDVNTYNITNIIQGAAGFQALHQLPPPPADFTGRQAELESLLQTVHPGGATITGVQGQGGIGKTTLALVLADRLREHYQDAQFFINLRGASQMPLTVADALAHVVRAYHPNEKLKADVTGLQAQYRSVLANQRAIVLLDDARDKAQVAPFLPAPSGCLVLVTSRQHFTLPGLSDPLVLETLPNADARALVLRLAPRLGKLSDGGTWADQIAELCGYLPLALTAAASTLQEKVTLTPRDYLGRLQAKQRRLELEGLKVEGLPMSVATSLSLSYDLLGAARQTEWRALAVFPDTFTRLAAAAVWEVAEDAAQDRLDELVRYSMLEWNATSGRHTLHDLSRLFADSRRSEAERTIGALRHARHYRDEMAAEVKQPGWLIRAFMEREFGNIWVARVWSVANAGRDPEAARLETDFARLEKALPFRKYGRIEHLLEPAVTVARQLGYRAALAAALGKLGQAYNQYPALRSEALKACLERLAIARELGDRSEEADALTGVGWVYYRHREVPQVIEYFEQALVIYCELGNPYKEASTKLVLCEAYGVSGDIPRARQYGEAALEIFEAIKHHGAIAARSMLEKLPTT